VNNVEKLIHKVDEIVKKQDVEKGIQYSDIFVEIGISHINQIIESASNTIPNILLNLLSIPEISKSYKL